MCQTLFPALSSMPTDRIQLHVEHPGEYGNKYWVKVADEIWPGFLSKPPKRLRIKLSEDPTPNTRLANGR